MIKIIPEPDNVEDYPAGSASIFDRSDGSKGLILKCPDCGLVHACSDRTTFDPATLTLSRSTVCTCGFHKTLVKGIWQ